MTAPPLRPEQLVRGKPPGRWRLDRARRTRVAEALLRFDQDGPMPALIAGSTKSEERVVCSLAGMLFEVARGRIPQVPGKPAPTSEYWFDDAITAFLASIPPPETVSAVRVRQLTRAFSAHWRDGHLAVPVASDDLAVSMWMFFAYRSACTLDVPDQDLAMNEPWPVSRLLEFWDEETSQHVDRRSRW